MQECSPFTALRFASEPRGTNNGIMNLHYGPIPVRTGRTRQIVIPPLSSAYRQRRQIDYPQAGQPAPSSPSRISDPA